jgi:hypothetical protein
MTWVYSQSTGVLSRDNTPVAQGYSGNGNGKNNPAAESVHDTGPTPRGQYTIGAPVNHPHTGNYSLRLTPAPGTNTFRRSGFLIHGDSAAHPGQASNGCIVVPLPTRQQIWNSGDHQIQVVR